MVWSVGSKLEDAAETVSVAGQPHGHDPRQRVACCPHRHGADWLDDRAAAAATGLSAPGLGTTPDAPVGGGRGTRATRRRQAVALAAVDDAASDELGRGDCGGARPIERRWLIERYHYVLKSGCGIEQLQLETAERLERALAVCCIVAWRLLWLTYQARETPEVPCTRGVCAPRMAGAGMHGARQRRCRRASRRALREAVRMVAQLGGFLARKGDGEPGVKTLWRGLIAAGRHRRDLVVVARC